MVGATYKITNLDALNLLTLREKQVLEMRMGIGEYERKYSLREIGDNIDRSTERIRQIEAKALRKLRHPSRNCEVI